MQVWHLLHAARWKHRTQKSRQKSPSEKNLVKQQYVLHMSPQYGELRPTSAWDRLTSLGYPCKFQLFSHLGSVTARHLVVGISQTLRRWTEGATYIWQGDHHVGHWPTFLVIYELNVYQFARSFWHHSLFLWSPYVIGQTIIFLPCGFYLSVFFFLFFLA